MNELKRFNAFLQRATEMHGDKYDYSNVKFVNYKTKIEIICPVHGSFLQTPDKHLSQNCKGCTQCGRDYIAKLIAEREVPVNLGKSSWNIERFLEAARDKYGNKFTYNFEKYISKTQGILGVECPEHGYFEINPRNHLISGHGCPKCGRDQIGTLKVKTYDSFLKLAGEVHEGKYEYPDFNKESYFNRQSKVSIICPEHGLFTKGAEKHLSGQGCYQCVIQNRIKNNVLVGGYCQSLFDNRPELKLLPARLYYLSINNGELFKIGITRSPLSTRISGIKSKGLEEITSVDILTSIDTTLYQAFLNEQRILQENDYFRVFRYWSSELFSKNIIDQIDLKPGP